MTIVTRMMVQSVRYVSPMNLELWQQVSCFGLTATSVDAGCTTSVHLVTILPAVDISAPSALTSNRAPYSLSTVLFVCVLYVAASKLKFFFFVFFVCVLYVDASKLKFIFFVFNVCLQVQNHFFFMCMCVVVAFQVEIHFFKSKIDGLLS